MRRKINEAGIRLHPKTLRLCSRIGARMLGADGTPLTAQGERWLLARGTEDHEARQREKVEEAARERRANELLGR